MTTTTRIHCHGSVSSKHVKYHAAVLDDRFEISLYL